MVLPPIIFTVSKHHPTRTVQHPLPPAFLSPSFPLSAPPSLSQLHPQVSFHPKPSASATAEQRAAMILNSCPSIAAHRFSTGGDLKNITGSSTHPKLKSALQLPSKVNGQTLLVRRNPAVFQDSLFHLCTPGKLQIGISTGDSLHGYYSLVLFHPWRWLEHGIVLIPLLSDKL